MQPKPTKSDIFIRAHELRRMNAKSASAAPFGTWLRIAWREALTGNTRHWLWITVDNRIAWLYRQHEDAYAKSLNANHDQKAMHDEMARIAAEIATLEASNAPAELRIAA